MTRFLAVLALFATSITLGQHAHAIDQDAAYSKGQAPVVNNFGGCVRTKWTAGDDVCNPTPPPAPVAQAAPQPKIFASKAERTVYFDFDSAKITDESMEKLVSLAKLINSSTKISDVRVVGYTDQFGSTKYNQKLSESRVNAATEALGPMIRLGIKPENMDLYGAGKSAPKEACKTVKKRKERIACMQEERRVEIVLNRQYLTR